MSTDLMTMPDMEVAYFGGGEGSDGLDIVQIKVLQPKHVNETRKGGNFIDDITGIQFVGFDAIVPLKVQMGRVLFPPGEFQKGVKPICRSNDGLMPVLDDPDTVPQCERCIDGKGQAVCPQAIWKNNPRGNGKKIKPPCQEQANFTFADVTTGITFRLTIKGSSITPFKGLRKAINRMVTMSRNFGNPTPFYGLSFSLKTTKIDSAKGTWFELLFGDPRPLENPYQFRDLYEMVRDGKINEATEADSAVDSMAEGY